MMSISKFIYNKRAQAVACLMALATSPLLLSSCSEWLDVQPETQVREEVMFEKYKGFQDALSGIYLSMADQNVYGKNLTMDMIEMMACLWNPPTEVGNPSYYYLFTHDYTKSEAASVIQNIYGGLFNIVAQANNIIVHLQSDGGVIPTERARYVIEGEAYAVRAFCQFDILRLFGQMPQNAQRQVSLPYAETPSIEVLPTYYAYSDYVKKLEADLNHAEQLLTQSDPAVSYGYETVSDLNDDFLTNRRYRMNVWAVKALKARFYQYIGDAANAYKYAKEVINAQANGNVVVNLAKGDLDGVSLRTSAQAEKDILYSLPSECLFALSNPQMADYAVSTVGGATGHVVISNAESQNGTRRSTCHLTSDMLSQLFAGQNLTANNRYLKVWEKTSMDVYGNTFPTIKKYYYDTSYSFTASTIKSLLQIMPLIRLSELYLIAMETTSNLSEGNALYKKYMESHAVNITTDFESLEALRTEVVNEYRREFIGEGVMFYAYKRMGTVNPLWSITPMSDAEYILPLPSTEYESK